MQLSKQIKHQSIQNKVQPGINLDHGSEYNTMPKTPKAWKIMPKNIEINLSFDFICLP